MRYNVSTNHLSIRSKYMYVKVFMLTVLAASGQLYADESLQQFAMYARPTSQMQTCELVGRRSSSTDNKVAFRGRFGNYGCEVSISRKNYEALFRFCFFSGINVQGVQQNDSFECFVQQREKDYVFLAQIANSSDQESQIMCYFTCLSK